MHRSEISENNFDITKKKNYPDMLCPNNAENPIVPHHLGLVLLFWNLICSDAGSKRESLEFNKAIGKMIKNT